MKKKTASKAGNKVASRKTTAKENKRVRKNRGPILYVYANKTTSKYAKGRGSIWGSFSAYVNDLIALDMKKHFTRGIVAKLKRQSKSTTTHVSATKKAA